MLRHRGVSPAGRVAPRPRDAAGAAVAAIVAAGAAAVAYRDVLGGYFWNDDLAWLFVLHERGLTEFLLTPIGGHTLVARNALFALLDTVAGLDPRPWFASVLLTHAVNVALLARLAWLFTRSAPLAGVAALAWGLCPAAADTLDWYSVYGQVAATTCLLIGLGRLGRRARDGAPPGRGDVVFIAVWLTLSSLFFGTVLAVAAAWPLVVALLFAGRAAPRRMLATALAVPAAVLVVYGGLQLVARAAYGTPVFAPGALGWALDRPLPTVIAFAQLLRVGVASLLCGAWWTPLPTSDRFSWLVLAAAAGCGCLVLWRATSDRRAALAAFVVLCLASYALIAVARAPLAGALFGQTAAQVGATMRYHYVPLAFLAVALAIGLESLATALPAGRGIVLPLAWAAIVVAGHLRHGVAVDVHQDSRAEITRALRQLAAGIAAAPAGAVVQLPNAPLASFGWLPNTTEHPPGVAALFVITRSDDVVDGRIVRFVEPNPIVREHARQRGGRTATLLVPPPAAQRSPISSSAWTRRRSLSEKDTARRGRGARSCGHRSGVKRTGMRLMPFTKSDRSRATGPSSSMSGRRRSSSSNMMRISSRARWAPRQKWGPIPKPR